MILRVDLYTKFALSMIALMLMALAFGPVIQPPAVQAQSDTPALYVEPGITSIPNPETRADVPGKLVIDLKTGDAWGFPMIFATISKPPTSRPIYLGRYDLGAIKRV